MLGKKKEKNKTRDGALAFSRGREGVVGMGWQGRERGAVLPPVGGVMLLSAHSGGSRPQ